MRKPPQSTVGRMVSAGGVVYRERDGATEVVLCGKGSPLIWALPKGTPNPEESLEETALREVSEETGLEAELVEPLGQISYWFVRSPDRTRCFKTVHFYLMKASGGSTSSHDPEFDVVRWFPEEKAPETMTYANEASMMRLALEKIRRRRVDGGNPAGR